MKKFTLLLCTALAACSPSATEPGKNSGSEHQGPTANASSATNGPSNKAYLAANAKMHADMNIALTGDADADFMRSMIPHHEGAVAMAKVALEFGQDPDVRKLANEVIKAQETEIAMMKAWLAKNGKTAPPAATNSGHEHH